MPRLRVCSCGSYLRERASFSVDNRCGLLADTVALKTGDTAFLAYTASRTTETRERPNTVSGRLPGLGVKVGARVRRSARLFQEEGEYEYASYKQDGEHSKEARLEPAVLYQPLHEAAGEGGTQEGPGSFIPVTCPNLSDPCGKHVRKHSGRANEGACPKDTRSCGRPSSNEGLENACTVAGVFISLAGFPESVPANVAKVIAGGGAAAAATCRAL
jgi:hypothetical protein